MSATMMNRARAAQLRERLFRITVVVKGVDAALEFVAGAALLAIKPEFIMRAIFFVTQDELAEDPRDFIANLLWNFAERFSIGTQRFAAIYLLIHGVVKILLVVALLKGLRWSYPWAMAVFGALVVYALYRFTITHSVMLVVLSVFDAMMIWLIWLEYRSKRHFAVA